jgi:regulator of sirC expression with transglutaminase-like and TPR domain
VQARLPASPGLGDKLYALNSYLFLEQGFGRERGDAGGHFLDEVLERRKGDAVMLGLVYMTLGRLLDVPLRGVPFPGGFFVRIDVPGEALFVDPLQGGTTLSREDLELLLVHAYGFEKASVMLLEQILRGVDDRQVLLAALYELKHLFLRRQAWERALWSLDYILSLVPDRAVEVRERAQLLERMGCSEAARADYRRYLELVPNAADAQKVLDKLGRLEKRGTTLH